MKFDNQKRVLMFKNKLSLCADVLMILSHSLCKPENYERLLKLSQKLSRKFSRSYLDGYWRYLFENRMVRG